MNARTTWIWQQSGWPDFHWRDEAIQPRLHETWRTLGILVGRVGALPEDDDPASALDTLLQNIVSSSAIEGEWLNVASVRSSLVRRNRPLPLCYLTKSRSLSQ